MPAIPLSATALYAGLNALIMLTLAVMTALARRKARVGLGLSEDRSLLWRSRAHGNHCEYVPYALVLIGILELGGQPLWLVHGLGAVLTLGRILHPIGLSRGSGATRGRVLGMSLTWGAIAVAALAALGMAILGW